MQNRLPTWEAGDAWRVDAGPKVTFGSLPNRSSAQADSSEITGEGLPLDRVRGVTVLSDSGMVVADAGLGRVMVFDTVRFNRRILDLSWTQIAWNQLKPEPRRPLSACRVFT